MFPTTGLVDPTDPFVQVIGTSAISRVGKAPDKLSGGIATVLAALVASRGTPLPHEEIADLCWPDAKPTHWHGLVSFYRRWLQERLPTGWTIQGSDEWELRVGNGWIDAWQLADLDPQQCTAADGSAFRGTPYPAILRRGVIARSAELLEGRQRLLPEPTSRDQQAPVSGRCDSHIGPPTPLPKLIEHYDHSLITGAGAAHAALALRDDQRADGADHHFVIATNEPSPLPFGDFAVALAPVRWPLLDIAGGTAGSRVAKAWRMTSDYLATLGQAGRQHIVVVDADRLDEFSLRLLAEMVRFPLQAHPGIVITGDLNNERESWQTLLIQLARASYSHISLCDTCSRESVVARRVVTMGGPESQRRLAG